MPTVLRKEYEDDKYGILDRCYRKITFCDTKTGEIYTDVMEIHVLELGKLPPEDQNEEGIIRRMRFLNAKSRKELKEMAKQDEYFGEAYEELERLSADEKKRLEYETRLKYKRDKYAQLHYATRIGREEGAKQINELNKRLIELGREEGQNEMIRSMWKAGISEEQIASIAQKTVEEVRKLCK